MGQIESLEWCTMSPSRWERGHCGDIVTGTRYFHLLWYTYSQLVSELGSKIWVFNPFGSVSFRQVSVQDAQRGDYFSTPRKFISH